MLNISNQLLKELADADIKEMRENIANKAPVAGFPPMDNTGQAAASLAALVKANGYQVISQGAAEAYIQTLEEGRPSGKMPPSEPIRMWVEQRGIATGENAKRVAFLIARKIGESGTNVWIEYGSRGRGTGILTSPISEESMQKKVDIVSKALGESVQAEAAKRYGM